MRRNWLLEFMTVAFASVAALHAAEHHGRVTFGGLPVPGATVTASLGATSVTAVTGPDGTYSFANLPKGKWAMEVSMLCFRPSKQDLAVAPSAPAAEWNLVLLPLAEMKAAAVVAPLVVAVPAAVAASPAAPTLTETAAEVFAINGSINNGAASPFGQSGAFGNFRNGSGSAYHGSLGMVLDNSTLDARAFSLTGQNTPKPDYNHLTGIASFGGPLKIRRWLSGNNTNFFTGYQWSRNRNAITQTSLMPTLEQRESVPDSLISSQARALLSFYPLPNFTGSPRYNYQIPIVSNTHQDSLQTRVNQTFNRKYQMFGGFAFQSSRSSNPNVFGFNDRASSLGLNANVNLRHSFSPRLYATLGYQFSRMSVRNTPWFENRENVSGAAGIAGNDQDALNWGPPQLFFASGIAGLFDGQQATNHNQTSALSYDTLWSRGAHNVTFGADFRRLQFNSLAQQNARGSFTFTGAATGNDFTGFLLGIPDTASLAFGNADKYFRQSSYDAYATDDWRVRPGLTVNAGIRWEYSAPITELYGRLVNFTSDTPVLATHPNGYPNSLVRPDKSALQPRVAFSWRPFGVASTVVRGGYGLYYNASVYQTIAISMAQQAPFSKSLSVQNSARNPLTLANGFNAAPATTPDTFGIDPTFRVGYAHNWDMSVQRDLPGGLVATATYLGIKGSRAVQEFLPNTYPARAVNPCPECPSGYAYMTSNGNSTRESGSFQLRRRLHRGFTASAQYTFSKSIDDAALGGKSQGTPVIAQNWLDLSAERGLSPFDQRHLLNAQLQYTSSLALKRVAMRDWTFLTQITAGSGLPETPVYFAAVQGTGVTGSIRPDYTGAPLYAAPPGLYLNPAAYTAPAPGWWGNVGRDTITGPGQFTLNASMARTFRLKDALNADVRFDAANAMNHVNYTGYVTTVGSAQFGLPSAANAMRSLQAAVRVRF